MGDHWCWYNPLPQGNGLGAVWSPAPGELWAAPDAPGFLLHRLADGSWRPEATLPGATVEAIWSDSPSSVWAVGQVVSSPTRIVGRSLALHWDGTRWTEVPTPAGDPAGDVYALTDVDGTGPDDVWAVGKVVQASSRVLHFDGTAWTRVALSPGLPFSGGNWARVDAVAPDDVWVVSGVDLLHWDGTTWTGETCPGGVEDVWAAGPDVVYRIRPDYPEHRIIERRSGSAWLPALQIEAAGIANYHDLARLGGSGPQDVWVLDPKGSTYHFDGARWSVVSSGPPMQPVGLWAEAPGQAVVVGPRGEIRELANGAFRRSSTRGAQERIVAISGTGPDDVWFVDRRAQDARERWTQGGLVHWDGADLREVPLPPELLQNDQGLSGPLTVWAPDPHTVWIGGAGGLLARRTDGGAWQTFAVTSRDVVRIWGPDAGEAWVIASGGPALRWREGAWSEETAVPFPGPTDVHGTARDDVWMTGSDGFVSDDIFMEGHPGVAHWDGHAWTILPDAPDRTLRVWATAPNDVWVTSMRQMSDVISHFDGTTFTGVGDFSRTAIADLWSPGPGEVFIATSRAESGYLPAGILRFTAGAWQPSLEDVDVHALWGTGSGELWTAGEGGAVLRRRAP